MTELAKAQCAHDWQIWPETDGTEQRCSKCHAFRKTPEEDKFWLRKPAAYDKAEGGGLPRWRHIKRGTTYREIGRAIASIAHHPIEDHTWVVVYQDEASGKLWVRNAVEFDDGRFEYLGPASPSPAGEGELERRLSTIERTLKLSLASMISSADVRQWSAEEVEKEMNAIRSHIDALAIHRGNSEHNYKRFLAEQAENATLREALEAAKKLHEVALPQFDWGRSVLSADAIKLLNEVPIVVRSALQQKATP